MQLPIVSPTPLVTQHAETFADLFENQYQFRHFQNYLTGLIVLPNKSLANIARCILDSADKTNLSRSSLRRSGFRIKSTIAACATCWRKRSRCADRRLTPGNSGAMQ
jgi:hypothetical protein